MKSAVVRLVPTLGLLSAVSAESAPEALPVFDCFELLVEMGLPNVTGGFKDLEKRRAAVRQSAAILNCLHRAAHALRAADRQAEG